jgi:hypothetical protein
MAGNDQRGQYLAVSGLRDTLHAKAELVARAGAGLVDAQWSHRSALRLGGDIRRDCDMPGNYIGLLGVGAEKWGSRGLTVANRGSPAGGLGRALLADRKGR